MKLNEMRELNNSELLVKLSELENKRFKLSFKNKITDLKNPMELKNIKKDIARLKTIIREKK